MNSKNFYRGLAVLLLVLLSVPYLGAQNRKGRMYGIAFYNLENLFDTINNNGKYDLEFSPEGRYQWDGKKYWKKIGNIAQVIESMKTKHTPDGPAVIGVSDVRGKSKWYRQGVQTLTKTLPLKSGKQK